MGSAQKCKCGHVLTDHLPRAKNNITMRTKCEWYDCECELFKPDGKTHTYARKPGLVEPISHLVTSHQRIAHISDVREDGSIRG